MSYIPGVSQVGSIVIAGSNDEQNWNLLDKFIDMPKNPVSDVSQTLFQTLKLWRTGPDAYSHIRLIILNVYSGRVAMLENLQFKMAEEPRLGSFPYTVTDNGEGIVTFVTSSVAQADWQNDYEFTKNYSESRSFVNDVGVLAAVQAEWYQYLPMPSYLVNGETLPLLSANTSTATTGSSEEQWIAGGQWVVMASAIAAAPVVHNRIFRLSVPVDLNTFAPSYFTQRYDKIGDQIYTVDSLTGLANDLRTQTSTVTLASRGKAWRMGADETNFFERFYWPMYSERTTRSTAEGLSVALQNLQQRPVKIALRMFAFHGAIEQDELVLKLDGVRGLVVSNNATANTAFAVLSTSLPATRDNIAAAAAVTVERSDTLVLAEAPIDTTLRTITARLYDLAGNEVFVPISLLFDLTLKAIF